MLGYKLLDSGNFEKLEIINHYKIIRPSLNSPYPKKNPVLWENPDAIFFKKNSEGNWKFFSKVPESIILKINDKINIKVKFTPFGHLGFFPEQFVNWELINNFTNKYNEKLNILNLFAYSGISTLYGLLGNSVCHVDASKGMVEWAKENAELSNLKNANVRWITDDVIKFLKREVNRKKKYDCVILDPPTFGRGSRGEVWKIERDLPLLMEMISELCKDNLKFIILSCHTTGYSPLILERILQSYTNYNGNYGSKELYLIDESGSKLSGGFCSYYFSKKYKDALKLLTV